MSALWWEAPRHAPALVGRAEQIRQLDGALAALGEGRSVVVEACGEPGLGKTRLLVELGRRASAAGLRVRGAAGRGSTGRSPLSVYAEALELPPHGASGVRRVLGEDGERAWCCCWTTRTGPTRHRWT
ncbi:ATP-binding protein [Phytohabitans rumicis]|uniref:Orc1-like AAA ATPase domain-containing protein n=1 Tax=Phytohabitans rumicis TaxID=1076125 RepID=A0A6V8KTJ2_9ACTN|nr:ATP-binding protein [Phytohabitans rumicis]GFJ88433.1 hypothetical protein Prum_020750 [Phytohabitans rumicis]